MDLYKVSFIGRQLFIMHSFGEFLLSGFRKEIMYRSLKQIIWFMFAVKIGKDNMEHIYISWVQQHGLNSCSGRKGYDTFMGFA